MERERRLRKASEFGEVFRQGRAWSDRVLVLRAFPTGLERSRIGFAVNKRLGKAVVRNRIKRRLREAARVLPIRPGWDMVVIARGPAANAGFEDLRAALRGLLARAYLLAVPAETDAT